MKKWIAGIAGLFILTFLCIYVFIPAKIVIAKIAFLHATINGSYRSLTDNEKWEQWWHDSNNRPYVKGGPYSYNGSDFKLGNLSNNVAGIDIRKGGLELNSIINLVSLGPDSTAMLWQCDLTASNNPLDRLRKYQQALEIKKNMTGIMENFRNYVTDPVNVYGVYIYRNSTRDTFLLAARYSGKSYPSTAEIYGYLAPLTKSIEDQQGKITGYPMVNITKSPDGGYETQVAIPTNRLLQGKPPIFYRRLVPGNFMICEVTGGEYTIRQGMRQLELYTSDYGKTEMAIPFQSLITDRSKEPDTAKWITRLYMPVQQ
jgi:hypothetical protein